MCSLNFLASVIISTGALCLAANDNNSSFSTPVECSRTCRTEEAPKRCYYHFTLEYYTVMGDACDICTPNSTNSLQNTCQCVLADGIERVLLSVNRMLPGPSIEICKGDEVIVDVTNTILDQEITIHWHGILQSGSQYYDGAPYVTQCPIHPGSTFRYRWTGDRAGTYFWHSHTGLQRKDGVNGALTIRQPKDTDPHNHLYDHDLRTHMIFLNDWFHEYTTHVYPGLRGIKTRGQYPKNLLINGKGRFTDPTSGNTTNTPIEEYIVSKDQRYRFRLVNALGTLCPVAITFENHTLTIIESDARPLQPVDVNTIVSQTGERFDFIINADQPIGTYWIQVKLIGDCYPTQDPFRSAVLQVAKLRYKHGPDSPLTGQPTFQTPLPEGIILNALDTRCDTVQNAPICVNQLKRLGPPDYPDSADKPDVKLYLPFGFKEWTREELYTPNNYGHFFVTPRLHLLEAHIDDISFVLPSSPSITQFNDAAPGTYCNSSFKPSKCKDRCTCTHIIDIPLHSIVELIVFDTANLPRIAHPFHLHGYSFSVLGIDRPTDNPINLEYIKDLDEKGLLLRNFDDAPLKDTVIVPQNGYVVIRFNASNPGFWLFHCHVIFHAVVGMAMIFNVGSQTDLPPVPNNFPECGSFIPSDNN